jgi:low affinity Fe/Cu permease
MLGRGRLERMGQAQRLPRRFADHLIPEIEITRRHGYQNVPCGNSFPHEGGTFVSGLRYRGMAPRGVSNPASRSFAHALTSLGVLTARPIAFVIFGIFVVAWIFFDHQSLKWHEIATLATWFMTLVIQRAEHRDTQAIHAKLDELLRSQEGADEELTRVDEEDAEDVEEERERAHARAGT